MAKRVVILHVGQGSQTVGMGKDFFENSAVAKGLFESADQRLGVPLSDIMFSGPESELTRTAICQPALYLHSFVCLELLREKLPDLEISAAAGLSLGEITAYAGAGSFSFESGLDLVAKRGRFMEEATAESDGSMAVMQGGKAKDILPIADRFEVEIANYNAPHQMVISGPRAAIESAVEYAEAEHICATQILDVSGAFHSRLMSSAQRKLADELERLEVATPQYPVISNVDAAPVDSPEKIRDTLRRQVTESVRWCESMKWLVERGETSFIQLGPRRSLVGLMRQIHRKATVHSIQDCESLEKTVKALSE